MSHSLVPEFHRPSLGVVSTNALDLGIDIGWLYGAMPGFGAHIRRRLGNTVQPRLRLPQGEAPRFGPENLVEILGFLEAHGFVHRAGEWWQHERSPLRELEARLRALDATPYPADTVSLRSVSSDASTPKSPAVVRS